jgi:uncharacterized membrane protein
METTRFIELWLYQPLLYTHIFSGMSALLAGTGALVTTKGGKTHRASGKVFFWAMLLVSFTALCISIFKSNDFLLALAVFTFYMNYTGYRTLKNRSGKFAWYDWVAFGVSVFAAILMAYLNKIVLWVFGAILLWLLFSDLRVQLRTDEKIREAAKRRVLNHLGRMTGTFIATFTAFVVVNINFVKPVWLLWLLPTFVGVPFIIVQLKIWKKKLKLD